MKDLLERIQDIQWRWHPEIANFPAVVEPFLILSVLLGVWLLGFFFLHRASAGGAPRAAKSSHGVLQSPTCQVGSRSDVTDPPVAKGVLQKVTEASENVTKNWPNISDRKSQKIAQKIAQKN